MTLVGLCLLLLPRLLVLTDIGGDPDDQQSMVRLMLYANEFEIEGLIASASGTRGELKEKVVKPHLIREIVEAYGKVRDNLARHAPGYPVAETLLGRIKSGNPDRGVDAIGEGHDTEGSRWIIEVADRADSRPVNICIWGGQTDLAQALWRVRAGRGAAGLKRFIERLRIYDIADQDGIAAWIWREFPGLFYVLAKAPEGQDKRNATFRGMYLGGDESITSREWIEENVRQGHGALGASYPNRTWTAPNPHAALKEGDTPSWFFFLSNGLSDPEHPGWGGWGGRFQPAEDGIWKDAHDTVGGVTDARNGVSRWRDAFQRDFQARLDWCVKPPDNANHPPRAVLDGNATREILSRTAAAGSRLTVSAAGSSDPDGQGLTYRWWIYPEAGSGKASLSGSDAPEAVLSIAKDAPRSRIHVVLEVTDGGAPLLTSFRRLIVQVR